jgi:hypothetical protein
MKKYDNYKDSGIDWIGEIPSHWSNTRIKFTVKENIEDSYANAKIKKTITSFTANKCVIKLLPTDTVNLTNNIYDFDIELTDYASDKTTVLSGELPVNLDVTNG